MMVTNLDFLKNIVLFLICIYYIYINMVITKKISFIHYHLSLGNQPTVLETIK